MVPEIAPLPAREWARSSMLEMRYMVYWLALMDRGVVSVEVSMSLTSAGLRNMWARLQKASDPEPLMMPRLTLQENRSRTGKLPVVLIFLTSRCSTLMLFAWLCICASCSLSFWVFA